jgi:pSer/pThr/pTyr-binding forkhead associated (FHA) protein
MGVRLTVKMKGGDSQPVKTVLLDQDPIVLGRDEACQVVLSQQAVSRTHAQISRDGTLYFLEDLGSSFGTQLNGQKLPKGEKRLLRNGDTIAIAQFDVVFDRVADVADDGSDATAFLSRKVVKDVMKGLAAGGEHAYFRVMNGTTEGQRIELSDAQEYVFGRDAAGVDVVLNDDLVSRRHVKVRRDWSGTHVEDLGSRNGIKINKKCICKASLKDRDELEIGGVRLLFIDPTEMRDDQVVLPSADDAESTLAVKEEPPAPEPEEPPSEAESPPEEPPAEEPAPNEAPGGEAFAGEAGADQTPADGQFVPEGELGEDEGTSAGPLVDLSNRQHVVALLLGSVLLIVGLVVIGLLIAGF